ncbi:MAG: Uncharacterized conserved protein, DUF169 family [Chloroflexi bacterium]|nr:MAG: Uncharacterized conserved protein, DUF169 family [Chloroflexota bacterium]
MTDWQALDGRLREALGLSVPPIAITFRAPGDAPVAPAFGAPMPDVAPAFGAPMPDATPDGRTGSVAAGCVFWMEGADATFTTVAADHGNCSVGSVTHGFKTLQEVAGNADVAALLESNWVTMEVVPQIPVVKQQPAAVVYGPLLETPVDPDVVLLRVTGRQLMVLHDAIPELRIEGKPQCHIVAIAKEQGQVAASVGCQLSRVRTAMPNAEMTCAIPSGRLENVIERVEAAATADRAVAAYAADDMVRFS